MPNVSVKYFFAFALVWIAEIPTYIVHNSENPVRNEPFIDFINDFIKTSMLASYTLVVPPNPE